MVRIQTDVPNTSVWRDVLRPMASSPRIITQTCNGAVRRRSFRREASRAVHRPSACSGIKALRNTSDAKAASRQALLPFRSLDPFRALREPDRRRPDEERLSRSEQRTGNKPKHDLTGKAPYRFESGFLQRRVHCEPVRFDLSNTSRVGRRAPGFAPRGYGAPPRCRRGLGDRWAANHAAASFPAVTDSAGLIP